MSQLDKLQNIVREPMAQFREMYLQSLRSEVGAVDKAASYIMKSQGKHMRPLLTILSGGACGQINDKVIASAVLVELTHTASLIHDDIVDDAFQRRSKWSVGALWRSRHAVLLGDYVLAKGINIAIEHKLYDVIGMVSGVIESMSKGEILQSSYALSMDIDKVGYYKVIGAKTAALISAASASGAISSGGDEAMVEAMRQYGWKVGEAFQIKDDILDYTATSIIGKPVCGDIKERKITLPLILALEGASAKEQREILNSVRDAYRSSKDLRRVRDFVISRGGIERACEVMDRLKSEAIEALDALPDSDYKSALVGFVEYTLNRDK